MEKMTYVKALDIVLATAEMSDEVREKLEGLKASMEKRKSVSHKSDEFTEQVYQTIDSTTDAWRCGDIAKVLDVSGQKVSAALTKLVKAGRVIKTEGEKKVSMFSIAH